MSYLFTKDEQPTMQNFNEKLQGVVKAADFKIGDTLTTTRTDLWDNWLLANGGLIHADEYPELGELLGAGWTTYFYDYADMYIWNDIVYENGKWVGCGYNSSTKPVVAISETNSANFTFNQISTSTGVLYNIAYGNGVWVAVGASNTSGGVGQIFVATDPYGEWTNNFSFAQYNVSGRGYVAYGDGRWVVCFLRSDTTMPLIYTTTDPYGEWTTLLIDDVTLTSVNGVAYGDGKWVIPARRSGATYGYILTDPTSASRWTKQTIVSATAPTYIPWAIMYANGLFGLTAYTQDTYQLHFFCASDPSGTWTRTMISAPKAYSGALDFDGEKWLVASEDNSTNKLRLFVSFNPVEEWTEISEANVCDAAAVYGVASNNGEIIYCSSNNIGSNKWAKLPAISQDKTYTYIKAKED